VWDGEIEYPDSFNIRDEEREIRQLAVAKNTATDPKVLAVIDYKLLEMMGKEPEKVLTYTADEPVEGRTYEDGEPIDPNLPAAYVPADTEGVPTGQNCGNCEYWDDITGNCSKFDAPVRATYWCRKWDDAIED
jgi:hypothetical protein